jgi:hypothetical protein
VAGTVVVRMDCMAWGRERESSAGLID